MYYDHLYYFIHNNSEYLAYVFTEIIGLEHLCVHLNVYST